MSDLPPEYDDRTTYMTEKEIFVDDYAARADAIASREHKASTIFDKEDIKQEIWMACFKEIDKLLNKSEGFIVNFMNRAAGRFVEKARVENMYHTGTFIYTPQIVRTCLEIGAWESTPEGDWDMRLDVRNAYQTLNERQRDVVFRAYRLDESLSSAAERVTLKRALEHMANVLNQGAHIKAISLDDVLREEA